MSAARDRLAASYYNSQPVSVDNPGGMDDDGHVTNFPAALVDVGVVAGEVAASAEAADTAKGQAQAAATAADNSLAALNLGAGAITDAAAASATAAAGSAAGAQRTVANNFPDRLDATGSWFSEAAIGDPGVIASPATAPVMVAGYGYEYAKANAQGQLFTKGALSASQGKVYEIEAEIHQVAKGGAETPAAAIGLQGLDDAFDSTGDQVQSPLVATPVGVTVIKYRFAYAAPAGGAAWPQPGTSIWLRPFVLFNRKSDDSGPVAASTARVRRLTVRDVTAVVAAETAQAAAATSAATLTYATTAEAQSGTEAAKIMSPARVKEAIEKFTPFPIASYAQFASSPGAPWIARDGKTYLKSTYPGLAAALGAKFAPAPTETQGAAYNSVGVSSFMSVGYSAVAGQYFVMGGNTSGYATLYSKARAGGTNGSPTWAGGGYTTLGYITSGPIGYAPLANGVVGGHNVIAFSTSAGIGIWNIALGAFYKCAVALSVFVGTKVAIGKGLLVARAGNTIGVANTATANDQMTISAKAGLPGTESAYGGLGVEFSSLLNAFVTCTKNSNVIFVSTDAAAAVWTATANPAPVDSVQDFCVTTSGHVFVLGGNDLWVTADLMTWRKIGRFPGNAGTATTIWSIGGLESGCCNLGYFFDQNGIADQQLGSSAARCSAWDGKGLIEVSQYYEDYRSFPIDLATQFCVGEPATGVPGYWKAA